MLQIITGAIGLAGQWLENRKEVSKQKGENKRAELRAESKAKQKMLDNEGAWERIQAEASKTSWKDEAWTLFFIIYLMMIFCASFFEELRPGLDVFSQQISQLFTYDNLFGYAIFLSILASFGLSIGKFKK